MNEHDTQDTAIWAPVDPIRAGVSGRCPRCGNGSMFRGFLAVREHCPSCGLDNSFADSGDGPVVFVVLIVGFVVLGLALWMEVNLNPPLWLHFLMWVPLTIVLGLLSLRVIKGLLIALQYRNKAASGLLDKN